MKFNGDIKMKKICIFDFDGTFYSGEHKFDKVGKNIEDNRRSLS